MSIKKRVSEDVSTGPKAKKAKVAREPKTSQVAAEKTQTVSEPHLSSLLREEVDFPRGGGTSFTPFEVKAIRQEGLEEANQELFREKATSKKRRKSEGKSARKTKGAEGTIRVEHLNYKRLAPGMKILGQVVAVQPLALIVSLPNQLLGHVPITNITSQLTSRLETMDEEMERGSDVNMEGDVEDDVEAKASIPDLLDMFKPGQYVRTVVVVVHSQGSTTFSGLESRPRDDMDKASRRVELSLLPNKVNATITKADLKPGYTLSAAIQSVEDHGYILDLGIPDISGFLPREDAQEHAKDAQLVTSMLIHVNIVKSSKNGRTFTCSLDPISFARQCLSEISNASSLVPGLLVQSLVTAVLPRGLNLQVLGFLDGTVDEYHIPHDSEKSIKIGEKVKARILYQLDSSTPPKLGLSLANHVVNLDVHRHGSSEASQPTLLEAFPIGTILETVEVRRVEPERGLVMEVAPGLEGFVHISQVSDEHVPTLPVSTGPWKIGTLHRARVTGYIPFDGLLQLTLRASILEQKFLQVSDVAPGEVVKATVKKLTDAAMFVTMSGSVDGVIWPNHYADIILKHPAKRFRAGGHIKCRVLVVDPERNRIALTAKKTLVESSLPVVASWEDLKIGVVTHAVVFKVAPKSLQVEFYNNLKAVVPIKEVSDTAISSLADAYPVGKPVKVRIVFVDTEERKVVASIRQAASNFESAIADVSGVEVGHTVEGAVSDIHKDNVVLTLRPTQIRALLSLNNLANKQGSSVAQLRASLKKGQLLQSLLVVSRNIEKGLVIVASKPKNTEQIQHKGSLTWDTVEVGQLVGGRVIGHSRRGATIKLGPSLTAALHPTDCLDDYDQGSAFPAEGTILKAVVVALDKDKRAISVSTRPSRMLPEGKVSVVDREIPNVFNVKVDDTVRGFIKSITEHGLFVYVGRNVDARVQIKELFDDYVKDWKSRFQINQLVKGRILSANPEKNQLEMTFRSGNRTLAAPKLQFSDLSEGQKVQGRVKKVEEYGIFIQIDDSKVSGLCHKSELSDNPQADVALALRSFQEGDRVKAVILSIDHEKRRLSLGLKPSYFDQEDFADLGAEAHSDGEEQLGAMADVSLHDAGSDTDEFEEVGSNGIPNSEASGSEDDEVEEDEDLLVADFEPTRPMHAAGSTQRSITQAAPSLSLGTGFQWSATDPVASDSGVDDSSEDEDAEGATHRKKRRRKEIEQDLTADLHTKTPQSTSDFERLLLGSPNSSYLWIQYMSFQLQLAEVDKAREVARRALRTINFREEQEKLNVWVAMLNLENAYGTDETLESVFKEAARANESKTVHLRLAAILDQSEKVEKAEEQYKRTCKKFGQSSKVWSLFGEFYMQHGKLEDARKLLPRSLQSLEKRKHLKTISRFAQMEYKLGEPERGRTIFEGMIDSHPKRLDIWSVYIDMEVTQQNISGIRQLFDRVLSLKMTSHKAKAFFKKWLELERRLGDEEGQEVVKQKAVAWTRQASSSSS